MELLCIAVIVACWVVGGQIKGRIRDIPIPVIIALFAAFKMAWWMFFIVGATYQMIRLGYGNYDPENDPKPSFLAKITHWREGYKIRALWGLLCGLAAIPVAIYHNNFISTVLVVGYVALNVAVNYLVSKKKMGVLVTDILVGATLGSIIIIM